jgi:hypothetical protein
MALTNSGAVQGSATGKGERVARPIVWIPAGQGGDCHSGFDRNGKRRLNHGNGRGTAREFNL